MGCSLGVALDVGNLAWVAVMTVLAPPLAVEVVEVVALKELVLRLVLVGVLKPVSCLAILRVKQLVMVLAKILV